VQRRLRHETWRGSPVHLRGVNEQWVAQIDCAGVAGRPFRKRHYDHDVVPEAQAAAAALG
jgi:hypothetical protein